MTITCKNCGNLFEGKYCNNCGQPSKTSRLNFHVILEELQYWLLRYNSEITYTAVQLYTRPGHAIRQYIEGKRIKFFKPISLVIVLSAIYAVLNHLFGIQILAKSDIINASTEIDYDQFGEFITNHFGWFSILSIPMYTIGSYFIFKKQGYNFVEHIVLNAYIASQRLYLNIATFPLIYLLHGTPAIHTARNIISGIGIILFAWTYTQFFNKMKKAKTIFFSIFVYLIFILLLSLAILLGIMFFKK
jgi:hypothetical protein